MFNLEQFIAEWRRQMLAVGIKTPVPLEELENHLREEIGRLVESGLDEHDAFNSAIQKIGPVHALQYEFKKVEATKEGCRWKLFEIYFLVFTFLFPLLVGGQAFFLRDGSFLEMSPGQQMSSLAAAVTCSLLAWSMRLGYRRFPVIRTNQIRDAIFVPVVLWLVVLAYIIMPRGDFTLSQRAVVSLWGFAPFGILVGWLWGFVTAAQIKAAPSGS